MATTQSADTFGRTDIEVGEEYWAEREKPNGFHRRFAGTVLELTDDPEGRFSEEGTVAIMDDHGERYAIPIEDVQDRANLSPENIRR